MLDFKSLRTKSSLAIIVTAAILVEITSGIQYYFAKEGIREEVEHRAESELRAKSLEIRNVMNVVEVAVENMAWAVEQRLSQPDSMWTVTRKLLADNEYIVGSAIAFEPYYYPRKGRQFSPYTYKHDSTVTSIQLGTDQYDYHSMEWYTAPMASGRGHWSEPYFDEGGGEMMMSTYSLPIRDKAGKIIAIFTADVSLDWLSEVVNAQHIYPSSYNLLLSRTGQIMVCPEESLAMSTNIEEATAGMSDTTADYINRQMKAGNSGQATVTDNNGEKNYVFYGPVDDVTGWSMAVVCADKEIYRGLRGTRLSVFILMLVGMCLLGFIIWRTARGAHRLQEINAQKERMEGELEIAQTIQSAMLPKVFPPFVDRPDLNIYGVVHPAKEVGGDLYDFYVRHDKLFFCVGDVSGKGVPASLVMAMIRSLFRSVTAHEEQAEQIMRQMNDPLTEQNEQDMFATLFIGVLDMETGVLDYCNGGHNAPVLVHKRESRQLEVLPNLPIGIMGGFEYVGQTTQIQRGDTLFLYTDGLTEAENKVHAQYGEERMLHLLATTDGMPPRDLVETFQKDVEAFVNGAPQSDDLTMLAIRYQISAIVMRNDIQQIPTLSEWVDGLHVPDELNMPINLALEEVVCNVMLYAYPGRKDGKVFVEYTETEDEHGKQLIFTVSDSGIPFDPTKQKEADTSLAAEDREIGGLGIHLVRQLMDEIRYERVEGKNILTLVKKVAN